MTDTTFIREILAQVQYEEEDIETMINEFTEMFPQTDISILKTVDNWYDGTVFPIDGRYARFDKEDPLSGPPWVEVEKIELSKTENKRFGPLTDISVTIRPGSKANIKYELYPFEQGREFDISNLGFELTPENSKEFKETILLDDWDGEIDRTIFDLDDISLRIRCKDGIQYTLMKGEEILSGFTDSSYSFGEGDAGSYCHLHDGKIILENGGDVSSIVIIHGVFD